MKFAKYTFLITGILGLIVTVPQYFLEAKNGRDFPPPITHPEYYYGFIGVVLAWQIVFLIIAKNPIKYRLIMIGAVLEKASFGIPAIVLFISDRLAPTMLIAGLIDLALGVLFVIAFLKTSEEKMLNDFPDDLSAKRTKG